MDQSAVANFPSPFTHGLRANPQTFRDEASKLGITKYIHNRLEKSVHTYTQNVPEIVVFYIALCQQFY